MKASSRAIPPESEVAPDEDQRHLLTLEALAEIEAGEAIKHAFVQEWANRLSTKKRVHYGH